MLSITQAALYPLAYQAPRFFVDEMPKDIQFVSLATFSSVEDGKARTCLAIEDWESTYGRFC